MPASLAALKFCAQWHMEFDAPSQSRVGVFYRVRFEQGRGPVCSCPAFQRRMGRGGDRECKHVVHVMRHACLWNEQWYAGGDRTLAPVPRSLQTTVVEGETCPRCGGPVVAVPCGV